MFVGSREEVRAFQTSGLMTVDYNPEGRQARAEAIDLGFQVVSGVRVEDQTAEFKVPSRLLRPASSAMDIVIDPRTGEVSGD